MTELEQQIALCKWMGWGNILLRHGEWVGKSPKTGNEWTRLPNTNSLDVLHEMIKKLPDDNSMHGLTVFNNKLATVAGTHKASVNATAAKRREALLKTLNLWKD